MNVLVFIYLKLMSFELSLVTKINKKVKGGGVKNTNNHTDNNPNELPAPVNDV